MIELRLLRRADGPILLEKLDDGQEVRAVQQYRFWDGKLAEDEEGYKREVWCDWRDVKVEDE